MLPVCLCVPSAIVGFFGIGGSPYCARKWVKGDKRCLPVATEGGLSPTQHGWMFVCMCTHMWACVLMCNLDHWGYSTWVEYWWEAHPHPCSLGGTGWYCRLGLLLTLRRALCLSSTPNPCQWGGGRGHVISLSAHSHMPSSSEQACNANAPVWSKDYTFTDSWI